MSYRQMAHLAFVLALSFLAGCTMAPIKSEWPLMGSNLSLKSTDPSQAKMLIFNNSSKLMFGSDNTGLINIKLNGKGAGSLDIGEYIQLQVLRGKHKLELVHRDLFDFGGFKSEHEIEITGDSIIIEIAATPVSNKIQIHKEIPPDVPKFFFPYSPLK